MKILLDSHVKKAVVKALMRHSPDIDAIHLADWHHGALLHADDSIILTACYEEGRLWVTYDQQTIPDLLRQWSAEQRSHSGVVFGDKNTVPPNNIKAVASALTRLIAEIREEDTTNLVRYLRLAES